MRPFPPSFQFEAAPGESAYLALARHLIREIQRGRLPIGSRLPGSRTLAAQLGLSRNTVLTAYEELLAQGWLESRRASGTFVARGAVDSLPRGRTPVAPRRPPTDPGFPTPAVQGWPKDNLPRDSGRGLLAAGMPDSRLIPVDLLARAYRRVLKRRGKDLLVYGDPRGERSLREELVKMYSATRGMTIGTENVLITRGSQMALSLAARLLIRPGDRVAVERFGYRPLWDALRLAGATLVPVPVDDAGMCVAHLKELGPLRAVYLTPHHQYPTTVLLSPDRRAELLDWASRSRCAILEDDYDHEFQYRGQPVLPLMSADRAGVVIYVGGLSKVLAPGLRIGCLVGPAHWIEQAAFLRRTLDHQGDQPTEAAVAELLKTGEIQRHVRRMRRVYAARREVLLEELEAQMPGCLDIRVPAGGMALWARITDGSDPEAWASQARAAGVGITPGRHLDIRNRPAPFLRLGFAANDPEEIRRAVRLFARSRPGDR